MMAEDNVTSTVQCTVQLKGQKSISLQSPEPTLFPAADFDPVEDAKALKQAFKGFGCNEDAIIEIITKRSNEQRQEISKQFKTMFGKDLIKELKSELRGNLEDVIIALMLSPVEYYAKQLHKAISGIGTNEKAIIEILGIHRNEEIIAIREAYQQMYGNSLESDIKGDTWGSLKRLLVSLVNAHRDESGIIDHDAAYHDAQTLLRAGELFAGTDESTFNLIMCQRNKDQLNKIFDEYEIITGHDFETAIENEFSGTVKEVLLALVKCVRNEVEYLADRLHGSMDRIGTDDTTLIRIVVTRSEIDLEDIKEVFCNKYGKTLAEFIQGLPGSSPYPSQPGYPPQSGYSPYPTGGSSYPSPYPAQGVYPPSLGFNSNSPMYMPQPSYPPPEGAYPGEHASYPGAASHSPYPGAQQVYPTHQQPNYAPPPTSHGNYGGYTPTHESQSAVVKRKTPTVLPADPFDPRGDAEVLRRAMKGFGTDEKAIINCLARRTNSQRLEIAVQFKTMYGKDLIKDLKSELTGRFEDLIVAMMIPLPQYYARELYKALSGMGTDEDCLIETLCTLSNHEIMTIRNAYQTTYGSSLENDLRGDTGGHFKRLMTSLCSAGRDESGIVNQSQAAGDAQQLLNAGVLQWGTDESVFNMILCSRNYNQLRLIFDEYQRVAGHDIEQAIKGEFSGDIEQGLLAVVRAVRNLPGFFAKRLYQSMVGMGTNDSQLIRIVVTRSEIDMGEIKQHYAAMYGKDLAAAIADDVSGDYKKCLLALIGAY
ncbi:hypothetical protein FQA39_LY09425 [Lamprigera yunnana]|nr:hypothetical protein FQA39_LY09425 [Lamprigera yunnana]